MDANLLITLQNYGLSEKEAKVYLTVLELWTSIASTIARRAELNRVTTYTLLEDLKKDGIVNETTKEGVKYYSVISPDILLKQLEQKYESFRDKVPELLAIAEKFGNKTKVQFFEWLEGLKKMYNDLLTSKNEDIQAFLWREYTHPTLRAYFDNEFIPQRVRNKIKAKVILSDSKESNEYKELHSKKHLTETIVVKYKNHQPGTEINIYGNNKIAIAMRSQDEMMGIIIHSQKLHDTLLNIFNLIWESKHARKHK